MPEQCGEVIASHDVGPHRLEFERPDIVHIRYDGYVNLEQFKAFDEIIMSFPEPPLLYLLRDARRGGMTLPETRAQMVKAAHVARWRAVATYGASFQARTIVTLTNKAIRILKEDGPTLAFLDTEAEARAWIEEHRKQVLDAEDSTNQS
jgi:hypothetical protein